MRLMGISSASRKAILSNSSSSGAFSSTSGPTRPKATFSPCRYASAALSVEMPLQIPWAHAQPAFKKPSPLSRMFASITFSTAGVSSFAFTAS